MIDEATGPKELPQNMEGNKLWQESTTMMNLSRHFSPLWQTGYNHYSHEWEFHHSSGHCGSIIPLTSIKHTHTHTQNSVL